MTRLQHCNVANLPSRHADCRSIKVAILPYQRALKRRRKKRGIRCRTTGRYPASRSAQRNSGAPGRGGEISRFEEQPSGLLRTAMAANRSHCSLGGLTDRFGAPMQSKVAGRQSTTQGCIENATIESMGTAIGVEGIWPYPRQRGDNAYDRDHSA